MDNFEIGNADIVLAAILLDVDGILGGEAGGVLAVEVLPPEHGAQRARLPRRGALRQLHAQLRLQRRQLVADVRLQRR